MDYGKPVYLQGRGRGRGGNNTKKKSLDLLKPGKDDVMKVAQKTFEDVSAHHQRQVEKYLASQPCFDEYDEEEDQTSLNEEKIFKTLIEKFSGKIGDDSNSTDSLGKTQGYLMNAMKSESNICLICIDMVKRNDPIWCCDGCYCMFHINCIQKWVRDGVYQQTVLSEENFPKRDIPWFCPKCRYEYKQSECPTKYTCFCGKETDPQFDPWLVPHSCGQTCEKHLKPDCGHTCLLLCHPGPCPPCPKMVSVKCYCGHSPPDVRRCSRRTWSCGQLCGQQLQCGHHKCLVPCHEGECPACPKTSFQKCLCGRQEIKQPCASPQWQCQQVCGEQLSCGHHICEKVCHAGQCGPCPRGGTRTCPCGKTGYDLPCTEDVSTCADTCDKMLECGVHQCLEHCHYGPCGTCRHMIVKTCRCGSKKKELPCFKEYLCETKCTKVKDCGKHNCKRKCCDGNCPPCEQQCNKSLGCRNHKCESRCHTGQCYPCPLTVEVKCNCGKTKLSVPCGREQITRPPRCNIPCLNSPDCHHEKRLKHRCHFNRCPPCKQVCNKLLDGCQHTCPVMCHTAVFRKQEEKVERIGPWQPKPEIKYGLVDFPCPPCQVPLPITCLGKHETSQVACCEVKPYNCGQECGRQLTCTNHTCSKSCHEIAAANSDRMDDGEDCSVCEEPCSKPRPPDCRHVCHLPCHPGNCPICVQMIRMRCHCKVTLLHVECNQWTTASIQVKDKLMSCSSQCPKSLSCGHKCHSLCHSGECPSPAKCTEKTKVKCPCKRKSKYYPCNEVKIGTAKLECDEKCKENKEKQLKAQEEAENLKKEDDHKKQQQELEAYQRKLHGRKRKPRKQTDFQETTSFCQKYGKYISLILCLLILVGAVAWANLS